jgi:hypothetical protein
MAYMRSLERQGRLVSSLDENGQVRWDATERYQREGPNELSHRFELELLRPADVLHCELPPGSRDRCLRLCDDPDQNPVATRALETVDTPPAAEDQAFADKLAKRLPPNEVDRAEIDKADAIDVAGGAPVLVGEISPIGGQAAGGDEVPVGVDRGQLVPGRQRDDQIAMNRRQRAPRYDQTAITA